MRSGYGLRRSDKESTAGNSLHIGKVVDAVRVFQDAPERIRNVCE